MPAAIESNPVFSGNTAGNGGFWLEDYHNTCSYNPGTSITMEDLRAIHNHRTLPVSLPERNIGSRSAAPSGAGREFTYIANNFDVNFVGVAPQIMFVPRNLHFGTRRISDTQQHYAMDGLSAAAGGDNVRAHPQDYRFAVTSTRGWTNITLQVSRGFEAGGTAVDGVTLMHSRHNSSVEVRNFPTNGGEAMILSQKLRGTNLSNEIGPDFNWSHLERCLMVRVERGAGADVIGENVTAVLLWTMNMTPTY